MKYTILIEKERKSFGAYVPDLPGCVAVAKSRPRVMQLIEEAISLHLVTCGRAAIGSQGRRRKSRFSI